MSSLRRAVVVFAVLAIGGIIDGVFAKPPSKIIGGGYAGDDEFQFIVALVYRQFDTHFCGGSIVGRRHILTAGHCVDAITAGDVAVRVGNHHLDNKSDTPINVQQIVLHPKYYRKFSRLSNDLAILVLDQDLNIGDRVRRIQLSDMQPRQPDNSKTYVVAGWGVTNKDVEGLSSDLKKVNVKLSYPIECWDEYKEEGETLCGYHETGAPCTGDSGSPLVGDGKLVGVTSLSQCQAGLRNTFINVYHYRDWIRQVTG